MPVLAINSHVAHGYVGNGAAVFALRRLGVEVWPLYTVALSNHPGYASFRGRATSTAHLDDMVAGLSEVGVMAQCLGVVSGYLGESDHGGVALRALDAARSARPDVPYVLDPVMGDTGPGLYVPRAIAETMRDDLVPAADVVTPNAFELGWLTDRSVHDVASATAAAHALRARGPHTVVVTSLPVDGATLGILGVTGTGAWLVRVPRLTFPVPPNGAGDLVTGLLTGQLVRGAGLPDAMARTANAVHAVLEATLAANRRELDLVGAQAALADPPARLAAEAA
jgi:pyridoxine kinase